MSTCGSEITWHEECSKPDSRNSPHFLSEALTLYILPTNDLRRWEKMASVSSGGLALRFVPDGGGPPTRLPVHPHRPRTTKRFASNAVTNANTHLCQKSALKHCGGSILLSPGGPWGPGCPAGPGNPWGPSPGAPGGPCEPCSPGRPGSPAGRQRHGPSVLRCLLKMLDKAFWKHLANKDLISASNTACLGSEEGLLCR